MSDHFAVGIDLGTTYFRVCVYRDRKFCAIANCNELQERKTPSCVAYVGRNEWVVGEEAKRRAHENIENTFFSSKRMIGRSFQEVEILEEMKHRLFEIKNENGKAQFKGEERTICPLEISARILCEAKNMAEKYVNSAVTKAVITVPACFNDAQRTNTRYAAYIAGLEVLDIVNDTMAAAIMYEQAFTKNVLVVSVGGGSYDVSIIIRSGEGIQFQEDHLAGSAEHGGQDIDAELTEFYYQKFNTIAAVERGKKYEFRQECIKAKERLAHCDTITFGAQCLDEDVVFKMSSKHLKDSLESKAITSGIEAAINAAAQSYGIIDIILVGGSTRMKCIQQCIQQCIPNNRLINSTTDTSIEEAVVYGAAYHAYTLLDPSTRQLILPSKENAHDKGIPSDIENLRMIITGGSDEEKNKDTQWPCNICRMQ